MAEDTVNEQPKRRRGLRRQAEPTPVEETAVDEELMEEEDESSSRGITAKKGYATPSRRKQEVEEEKEEGNFITRPIRGLGDYLEGVRSEVQKVAWPTREETRRLTSIVLITMIVSSIVLGIISFGFAQLFAIGIQSPIVFGAVFVIVLGAFLFYLRATNRRGSGY